MLRSAVKFLALSSKTSLPISKVVPKLQQLSYVAARNIFHQQAYYGIDPAILPRPDMSTQAIASAILIYNNLKHSSSITELFFNIDKYMQYVNTNHLFIMVKKFYDFHDPAVVNPMIELNYNNMIRLVVQKFDNTSDEIDLMNLVKIYNLMTYIPYSSSVTKRCNFILEQKGLQAISEADFVILPKFLSALIRNGKILYARALIPILTAKLDSFKVGKLAHTAYDVLKANLETPEFVKKVEQVFGENDYIDKLRELELSIMIVFFIKNQNLLEDPSTTFNKLERKAISIRYFFEMSSFKAVLEALSKSNKPLFSKNFYRELEGKLCQKPAEMPDELLVLIFQEYKKFSFDSITFWERLTVEAFARSKQLAPEALVMIFTNFTVNNGFFPNILQRFTKVIAEIDISSLKSRDFDSFLCSLYQFNNTSKVKPSQEIRKICADFIVSKASAFSVQELNSVLEKRSFFTTIDQMAIIISIQQRIIKGVGFSKDNLDLKTLCNITNICLTEFPNNSPREFVNSVIDLSMALLLENAKEDTLNVPNSLEIYGDFLSLVSQQSLDKIYTEKRKKLFQIFEQHLLKLHEKMDPPSSEKPDVEDNLSKYVKALYSILDRSSEDIEKVHDNARSAYGLV